MGQSIMLTSSAPLDSSQSATIPSVNGQLRNKAADHVVENFFDSSTSSHGIAIPRPQRIRPILTRRLCLMILLLL